MIVLACTCTSTSLDNPCRGKSGNRELPVQICGSGVAQTCFGATPGNHLTVPYRLTHSLSDMVYHLSPV